MAGMVEFFCPACAAPVPWDEGARGRVMICPACGQRIRAPTRPIGPGATIAGYRVIRKLGAGGMGDVYLAEQMVMRRWVALKVLTPERAEDEEVLESFLSEARRLGSLNHPCIATGHDAGRDGGLYYLAMEYAEGTDLLTRLHRDGRWPEISALDLVRELAGALAYAWKKSGLVHRDLTPGNVILSEDGSVTLLDVGVSTSLLFGAGQRPAAGQVAGTPPYMSPEQLRAGDAVDVRSDMFSLGAMLYHLVTGTCAFPGPGVDEVIAQHAAAEHPAPRLLAPEISEACEALIDTLMAEDPDLRFADWESCLAAIDEARRQAADARRSTAPPKRQAGSGARPRGDTPTQHRRRGAWLLAAATIAAAGIAGLWMNFPELAGSMRTLIPMKSMDPAGSPSATSAGDPTTLRQEIAQSILTTRGWTWAAERLAAVAADPAAGPSADEARVLLADLRAALGAQSEVLLSYAEDLGQEIPIRFLDGDRRVRIDNVSAEHVAATRLLPQGEVGVAFGLQDLSAEERFLRLRNRTGNAEVLLAALYALEAGRDADAQRLLERTPESLAEVILQESQGLQGAAEQDIQP